MGQVLAEGRQAVREALRYADCRSLWVAEPAVDQHSDLVSLATDRGIAVYCLPREQLAQLCDAVTPQAVVAQVQLAVPELADLPAGARLVVVCAQVRDPGNAGTVIRCADAFGADAVILTEGSVELGNPKTIRASVGSIFHLPVICGGSLEDAVRALRARGMQILAADGAGSTTLDRLTSDVLGEPTAWLMGNEAWGLPAEDLRVADQVVAVPLYGRAESLNLATAAAVCLYTSAAAQQGGSVAAPQANGSPGD